MNKNVLVSVLAAALLLAVGTIGYLLNSGSADQNSVGTSNVDVPTVLTESTANTAGLDKLISYQGPNGWSEAACPNENGTTYFTTTNNPNLDCSTSPDSRVEISVSPEKYTECSQIPEKQDVKKHICASEFINNLRSLQANTEYLASSSFGSETKVQTYYIDTGSVIIKAEYTYKNNGVDQSGFSELVNSIKSK